MNSNSFLSNKWNIKLMRNQRVRKRKLDLDFICSQVLIFLVESSKEGILNKILIILIRVSKIF